MLAVLLMVWSRRLKKQSILIERRFFQNLRSREVRAEYLGEKKPEYAGRLLSHDLLSLIHILGVKPNVKPIRGGTDGAQLSFKGLPCPNIFAGGLNFHGRYEFVPIQNMEKAMNVIVKIAELVASK